MSDKITFTEDEVIRIIKALSAADGFLLGHSTERSQALFEEYISPTIQLVTEKFEQESDQ